MNQPLRFGEVADYLNVDTRLVRHLVDTQQLPVIVIGPRTRRILPSELQAYLERQSGRPLPQIIEPKA